MFKQLYKKYQHKSTLVIVFIFIILFSILITFSVALFGGFKFDTKDSPSDDYNDLTGSIDTKQQPSLENQPLFKKECGNELTTSKIDNCYSDFLDRKIQERKAKVSLVDKLIPSLDANNFIAGRLDDWKLDFASWKDGYELNRDLECDVYNLVATRQYAYDLCKLESEVTALNWLTDTLNLFNTDINYNDIVAADKIETSTNSVYDTGYKGMQVTWDGVISGYYSQLTGIKFCIIDDDHQDVIYNEPCDWFWAISSDEGVMRADDIEYNPHWDGYWVDYILRYFNVPFNKDEIYYDDRYTITGYVDVLDCGLNDRCIPNIEIKSITRKEVE